MLHSIGNVFSKTYFKEFSVINNPDIDFLGLKVKSMGHL